MGVAKTAVAAIKKNRRTFQYEVHEVSNFQQDPLKQVMSKQFLDIHSIINDQAVHI